MNLVATLTWVGTILTGHIKIDVGPARIDDHRAWLVLGDIRRRTDFLQGTRRAIDREHMQQVRRPTVGNNQKPILWVVSQDGRI